MRDSKFKFDKFSALFVGLILSFAVSEKTFSQDSSSQETPSTFETQSEVLIRLLRSAVAGVDFAGMPSFDGNRWAGLVMALSKYSQVGDWENEASVQKRLSQIFDVQLATSEPLANRLVGLERIEGPNWEQYVQSSGHQFRFVEVPGILKIMLYPDETPGELNRDKIYRNIEIYRAIPARHFFIENEKGEIIGFESWQKLEVEIKSGQFETHWYVETRPSNGRERRFSFEDWRMQRANGLMGLEKVFIWFHSAAGASMEHPAHVFAEPYTTVSSSDRLLSANKDPSLQGYRFMFGGPRNITTLPPRIVDVKTPLQEILTKIQKNPKNHLQKIFDVLEALDGALAQPKQEAQALMGIILRTESFRDLRADDRILLESALMNLATPHHEEDVVDAALTTISRVGLLETHHRDTLFDEYVRYFDAALANFVGEIGIFETQGSVLGEEVYFFPKVEKTLIRLLETNPDFLVDLLGHLKNGKLEAAFAALVLISKVKKFEFKSSHPGFRNAAEILDNYLEVLGRGESAFPRNIRGENRTMLIEFSKDLVLKALYVTHFDILEEPSEQIARKILDDPKLSTQFFTNRPEIARRMSSCEGGFDPSGT